MDEALPIVNLQSAAEVKIRLFRSLFRGREDRRFLPVTDDVIRWHLSGEDEQRQPFVAGV